ncbi:MAG: sigma 54-interacting transcriptional regulator [Candidatus Latescibacterota bacterium]|nr:sigma 54-interacting transcriptional regulator [Candidatus Latescibacterota bacterium]
MSRLSDSKDPLLWQQLAGLISAPSENSLNELVRFFAMEFNADSCALYLLDERTDELVLRCAHGDAQGQIDRFRLGQGITGAAAFHRKIIQVSHMQQDPRYVLRSNPDARSQFESIIVIPIKEGDDLRGVINLKSRTLRRFSEEEIRILEDICPLVLALLNAVSIEETMRRRSDEVRALNELGQAMNTGLELDESLELIASLAADVLRARGAAIRLIVEDGSLALATVLTELEGALDPEYEKRIAEYVADTGEPIMIDDVRSTRDPSVLGASMACIPLVLQDRIVGTLTLFDKFGPLGRERRRFSVDDLNMLFALSSQIAAEIEDIRLTGRLQELVRSEKQQGAELQQLYNRSLALLQSISDGLLAIDKKGYVEEINAVAAGILGRQITAGERILADELVDDKPPLQSWLADGGQFNNRVITLRTVRGNAAVMANLQPVMNDEKRVVGAVLTFREMGEVGRLVNRVIGVQRTYTFDDIIGTSSVIEKAKELARIAASTGSNILIEGETGTGKEVFAQAIHNASAFSEGPFLAVNCGAIPRDLIESELFGYVEGAFTGASKKGRLGKFELASGGTIFLDEIGELPTEVQVKLLRVLQEKSIVRVGADRTIPINCRLIAATNRSLMREVEEGRFRRDLLYRINVMKLEVPPLRDRQGDISLLAERFMRTFAERNGKVVTQIAPDVLRRLDAYDWPGNVRELENALEHAIALVKNQTISLTDMPANVIETTPSRDGLHEELSFEQAKVNHHEAVLQLHLEALRAEAGDVSKAAERLGISRATLYRRLKEYGLARTSQY